jgi:hypothetical protein
MQHAGVTAQQPMTDDLMDEGMGELVLHLFRRQRPPQQAFILDPAVGGGR